MQPSKTRLTTTESMLCESLAEGFRLEDLLKAFGRRDRGRANEKRSPRDS